MIATEIGEFGRWAVGWAERNGGLWPAEANLARLAEEVGEVARHVNAQAGRKALSDAAEGAAGEVGDALFVLALLAHQLGTNLDEAALAVRRKQALRERA